MKKIWIRLKINVITSFIGFVVAAILLGSLAGVFTFIVFSNESGPEGSYYIAGKSMEPTMSEGDRILVVNENKIKIGQIIVFTKPNGWTISSSPKNATLIKRVGAVSGDKISYEGRSLYVNGEKKFNIPENMKCGIKNGWEITIDKDQVMAVGDNPANSVDSRALLCAGYSEKAFVDTSIVKAHGTKFTKEK